MKKTIVALTALLGLTLAGAASAAQSTVNKEAEFTGQIMSVNEPAHTFVVRNMDKGQVQEMKFLVHAGERIVIDGEDVLLGQLEKGDWVTVTYGTEGSNNVPKHIKRHRDSLPGAPQFEGRIIAVDAKAGAFIVRNQANGKVQEMKFVVEPSSNIMVDGERKLVADLERGDDVTVTYTGLATMPVPTHVTHKKTTH